MKKFSISDLQRKRKRLKDEASKNLNYIRVGMSTCGLAAGARATYEVFREELEKRDLKIRLEKCGCMGMCFAEPLVEVSIEGSPTVIYGKVDVSTAHRIIDEHLCCGRIVSDHVYELHINQ